MEYTWVDQPMWQPLEAFRSDFIHLKIIIQNFTDQVSSPEATTATIDIESGWSYKPVFPHGYQVVKEALCQPEGVYFAGFFSKMSSEATEAAVKDQVARTEAELIQELKVSAPNMHKGKKRLIIPPRNNVETIFCCLDFNM